MFAAHDEPRSWSQRAQSPEDALAALILLSRSTAHEVSNALTAVLGYIDLAAGQLGEEHEARGAIAKAVEAAHSAARSIQGFSEEVLRYDELYQTVGTSSPKTQLARVSSSGDENGDGPAETPGECEDLAPGSTGLVLFAVADTFIRSILSSGLKAAGNEIIVASGFKEVLRLCDENAARHPVLVVDSALRGMEKGAGALRIRAKHPTLPVILMSTESNQRAEVEEGPSLVVLHKPFPIARLLAEINRCRWENGDDSR
jgi:hypothetical protein